MYMKDEYSQVPPFTTLQKSLAEGFMEGKISKSDIFMLYWLSCLVNPINYYAVVSYPQLIEELRHEFSYENLRKILIKLKTLGLIWFKDRKGKRGTFKVWVHYYIKKDRNYVDIQEIERKHDSQHPSKKSLSQSHDLDSLHTLDYREAIEKSGRSYDVDSSSFTTSYTETENEKETEVLVQQDSSSNSNTLGEMLKNKAIQLGKDVSKRRKNQSN